ncbi:MAG: ABC transporter permease [Proteobacteria bacterium]|nr:ABC transporter permease [Pseudomonadota bacterium]
MRDYSITPQEMIASFWHNRKLIKTLVKREVVGRYRGSILGIMWSFFNPMLMLAVYTFVFSVVFKARWNAASDSKTEFALVLFAGLLVFNLFAECVNRAPTLIISNTNYVKKVVFPLEILPWVTLGTALFHMMISFSVWLIFYIIFFGNPQLTVVYMPLIMLPLVLLTMGLSWFLASLGVFLRDVAQIVGIVTTTLMFLSPIFYPLTSLPAQYQRILNFNLLTPIIEQARAVLIWGQVPDFRSLGLYILLTAIIAWLGFAWFQKTRKGFADVL